MPVTAMRRWCLFGMFVCVSFALAAQPASQAQNAPPGLPQELAAAESDFFEKKIRPVLAESCYACHSAQAKKPAGGLLLDSRAALLRGGASGFAAVVPGDVEESLLIRAIRYSDAKLQMPMSGKLSEAVIQDFETWVKMGAPDPREGSGAATAAYVSPYDFNEAKKFWSFQPVKDHPLPAVKNRAWVKAPIDRFILAQLEEKKLKPLGDADQRTLLRRATFDLTGLPPTPAEVEAFAQDTSPQAFARVVDRLLASSAYGEKWGRHWLDVVRYADTAGDNSDFPITNAWRYRNYVIAAFNQDKPYDQFIREQLAGDLLAQYRRPNFDGKWPEKEEVEARASGAKKSGLPEMAQDRQEKLIATGYLALSRRFGSRNKDMHLTLDDTLDNLGKTFLGLSVSCARCHDHKFDPLPQRDYYALYGIFNSTRYAFPGAEVYKHPAEMMALVTGQDAEKFHKLQNELEALDDRHEFLTAEKSAAARNKKEREQSAKALAPPLGAVATPVSETKRHNESGAPSNEQSAAQKPMPKGETRAADFDRDGDNWARAGQSRRVTEENEAEFAKVKARMVELHNQYVNAPKAYGVFEGLVADARLHRKGNPKSLSEQVPRGFLTVLGGQQIPRDHPTSGRELLADWIATPANPLTARVMVNRLWQWHFGKGLVPTTNDFGARGKAATHPELLDYLAARFVASGWSVKKMHRLMMLSRVYQLASGETDSGRDRETERLSASNAALDVANDYLWRFKRRRLAAEEVRDALLAVSGQLDRAPGEAHPFPAETAWQFTQHTQFFATYETNQRSVYVMQQRLKKHPFFEVFDGADTNMSVGERPLSTTPLQALYLMNNPFVHQQADAFAARAGLAFDTPRAQLDYAFRLAYGRAPRLAEWQEAQAYLQQTRASLSATNTPAEQLNRAALASYLRVVLSSNEFLYVD